MQKSLLLWVFALLSVGTALAQTLAPTPRKDYIFYPRTNVLEEGTGTWCGYCPRGIATIERLRPIYGDRLIVIAVHQPRIWGYYDEPMQVDDYRFLQFGGFPRGFINRNRKEYTSMTLGHTTNLLNQIAATTPYRVEAEVKKVDNLNYELTTHTTLGFNNSNTQLRLQYVLVEDSVGPNYQSNYYSTQPPTDDAPGWDAYSGRTLTLFNDVARAIYPVGEEAKTVGHLPSVMRRGEPVHQTFRLFRPSRVHRPWKTRVAVLLIDNETEEILNATEVRLDLPNGIGAPQTTDDATDTTPHFDLTGRRIAPNAKGVHLMRGKKVMVRP